MQCPACKADNPEGAERCRRCQAPLEIGGLTTTGVGAQGWSLPNAAEPVAGEPAGLSGLQPGTVLGGRYEILQMLGEGGMGAVYKARDREVDRMVALKVIRPELAGRPDILKRFKQELILARQVTHRNVIRIFDLSQAEGLKFITMEYVEGQDLKALLRARHQFTPEHAVQVIRQVCLALDAAHEEGVIHRDLKPQNIMIDTAGKVVVMDFGVARTMEQSGLTATGALVGTPEYMSPEQAKGEKLDHRSDLFSLGVIFYELLTGKAPYESETVMGTLLKRVQERPPPPIEVNPATPPFLNDVVLRCLQADLALRYQSAREVLADLDAWQGDVKTSVSTSARPLPAPVVKAEKEERKGLPWKWIAAGAGVAVLAIGGFLLKDKFTSKPAGPRAPVTVMIADFNNATGEGVFDRTLEPMVKIALEGAGFVSAYDRTRLRDLGLPALDKLDEQAARKVAVSQGLGVVVSGSLDRQGSGYVLSARAIQAVTGNPVANAEVSAPNKDQVLLAVTKVATTIRKGLGDDTSESAQRFAMETLSASSLEAVHEYALAMEALSNGRYDETRKYLSRAVDLDPNFGLAYTILAVASRNMGLLQDAEKYIKLAIAHIDHMTERERYRTRGFFYLLRGDQQKCVEEYGALIARYSSDVAARNNLALCSTYLRNMPRAIEEMRRAVEILPKRVIYRANLSFYESYAGDFQNAEREARAVQQLAPSFPAGFMAVAFAQIGQGQLTHAAETYQKLAKFSPTDAAAGMADLALYEGRFSEAAQILERAGAGDVAAKVPEIAAAKFATLAYVQLGRGQKRLAVSAAESALAKSKAPKIRFLAARALAAAGESDRARELASGLAAELQVEPQAYAKLIEGEVALQKGDPRQAIKTFSEANALLDTWIGRFDLGRAYLEAGAFPEADSEFDRCIKRRGEALALFLDEVPTYGYFPPVYYYLGRVREGMKSAGFAESYRTYLSIRSKTGEDPLLAEVRRRAGQ